MANVVHGPFVKGGSTTGVYTGGGSYTSGNANNGETQSAVALASFNPDLITSAFILSGVACVKDATTASKLNITSGEAYLVMTDGTVARIDVAATNKTTVTPSTTYYLDLNPDGSWNWATTHSAQANYLPICQVTTDGSSNISGVTDKRVLLAQALQGAAHPSAGQPGGVALPAPLQITPTATSAYVAQALGGVTFAQAGALRGSFDGAATFNGTTGYLTVPTSGLPSGNGAWTLEGWFKTTASGINGFLWDFGTNGSKQGAQLFVTSANKLFGGFNSSGLTSVATVNDGAWHHAAVTWDGTNVTLYLDGAVAAGPTSGLGPGAIALGTASIGEQLSFGGNFYNGTLDECALYGAALSSARITAHYNAGISVTSDAYAATVLADSPLRYYRLGDASGATAAVSSGNSAPVNIVLPDATLMVWGIGGQAAALGSLGAPVIVAQYKQQHVTSTGAQAFGLTIPVSGLYRVSPAFRAGIASAVVTLQLQWTDETPAVRSAYFTIAGATNGLANALTLGAASAYAAEPLTVYAASGFNMTCYYINATATPNDFVNVIFERLA